MTRRVASARFSDCCAYNRRSSLTMWDVNHGFVTCIPIYKRGNSKIGQGLFGRYFGC